MAEAPRSSRFQDALAANRAPLRVGDVVLRYEPSMLIGETARLRRTLRPPVVRFFGFLALVLALLLVVRDASTFVLAAPIVAGALAFALAGWLETRERLRRRFIANFGTCSLRLDFATPFKGRARSLVVPFDAVRAVDCVTQADGTHCLTVDFAPGPGPETVLREVLAASVPGEALPDAERLQRVLTGAFGLGRTATLPDELL